jgi:hypothetical protein
VFREPAWKWQGVDHDSFNVGAVRIMTITWNMGGLGPRGDPHYDLFHLLNNEEIFHDIYVISAQECLSSIG